MLSDDYLEHEVYPERLDKWKQRFNNPSQDQFVAIAERGKKALGFVCAFGNSDEQWGTLLDNLHVHPDAQGEGLGKALMQQTARWVMDRYESGRLYLLVFEANQAACQFYEHMGGKRQGCINNPMPDGELVPSIRYVWEDVEVLLS